MTERRRLDRLVFEAGLAPSREKAQALILAGRISVNGKRAEKPGTLFPAECVVEATPGTRPFVSRGGGKLAGVLGPLGVDPAGWKCLDVGASTGGFTDVLLRGGAALVTAVDVGHHLLDDRLRADSRVQVKDGLNARYLTPSQVDPPYNLITVDLSFISLTLVLPALLPLAPEGLILALVKPQFELTPREVGHGGVVRDPEKRSAAVIRVAGTFAAVGWGIRGLKASPLKGPKGNREVFLLAGRGGGMSPDDFLSRLAEEVNLGI